MAASKPTNLLSWGSDFLRSLNMELGSLDIPPGLFPSRRTRHLAAAVERT